MQNLRGKLAALGALLVLGIAGGCASPVPGSVSTGLGKSITVTITCVGPMNPAFYYYFLINRVGAYGMQNARGPIPVLDSALTGTSSNGYGNGFATGSPTAPASSTDTGLTDYVFYNNAAGPNFLGLYHIPTNYPVDVSHPGQLVSEPIPIMLPDMDPSADINAQTTLSFRFYVSQLLTTQETQNLTSAQVTALANQIRWLQVNIVATDQVPTTQTGSVGKLVDSMGTSTSPNQLTSFLILDLSQNTKVTSEGPFQTLTYPEPQMDIWLPLGASYNPDIDIASWSIQVSP